MKKVLAILLALATLLVFAGCAKQADAPAADGQTSDVLIGISMPTHSDESWLRHCEFTKDFLRELGYTKFDEQWAEDVPATQVNQIENMITKGAKVLIVASVDGGALTYNRESKRTWVQACHNPDRVCAHSKHLRRLACEDRGL